MNRLDTILDKDRPDPEDLAVLLDADAPAKHASVLSAAYAVKFREVGPVVYFRGLFELSIFVARTACIAGSGAAITMSSATPFR